MAHETRSHEHAVATIRLAPEAKDIVTRSLEGLGELGVRSGLREGKVGTQERIRLFGHQQKHRPEERDPDR
ncbi:hypothetical protein ACFL5O_01340 [Myxococcota bacterium]